MNPSPIVSGWSIGVIIPTKTRSIIPYLQSTKENITHYNYPNIGQLFFDYYMPIRFSLGRLHAWISGFLVNELLTKAFFESNPLGPKKKSKSASFRQSFRLYLAKIKYFTNLSKKSPTGPTERTPQPEYLIALNLLRGPLVRSHSIFDGT